MKMRYFELAKRLTQYANHRQHRIGSVIVKKNRVISLGYNSLKTSPHSPHPYKSVHSEFNAIWGVNPEDLKGATIYIFREQKDGTLARAYPCATCLKLIKSTGIKTICYTDYNTYAMEIVR